MNLISFENLNNINVQKKKARINIIEMTGFTGVTDQVIVTQKKKTVTYQLTHSMKKKLKQFLASKIPAFFSPDH